MSSDSVVITALGIEASAFQACAAVAANAVLLQKLKDYVAASEATKERADATAAELEAVKINHERAESDLEKRVLTAGETLSKKNGLLLSLQKKQTETEKLLGNKTTELEKAATLTEELTRKLKRAELLAREQTEDIQNKDELLQKRQTELDRERDSSKSLFEEKLSAEKRESTAKAELQLVQDNSNTLTLANSLKTNQIATLKEQKGYTETQLEEHIDQSRKDRKEISSKLADVQRDFDEQSDVNRNLTITRDTAREENAALKARVEHLEKTAEVDHSEALNDQKQARKEVENLRKQANLHKKEIEQLNANITELSGVVAEMHKVRGETQESTSIELEDTKAKLEAAEANLLDRGKRMETLEDEIRTANMVLERNLKGSGGEDPHTLNPAASLASSKMGVGGQTLTQIYSSLIVAEDARQAAEIKSQKLEKDLKMILREFESKAPALRKQKEDLDAAEGRIVELNSRLEQANSEVRQLDDMIRTCNREKKLLERERRLLETTKADQGKQLQALLVQAEERSTGRKLQQRDAAGVIDSELVTVDSVAKMQKQNCELRAIVRELSEQREAEERARNEAANHELQGKLDAALREKDQLREERLKQEEAVMTIVRQRDMFKTLYLESEGQVEGTVDVVNNVSPSRQGLKSPGVTTSRPASAKASRPASAKARADQESAKLLHELQTSFEAYRVERSKNDATIAADAERVKSELEAKRLENAKLEARIERLRERAGELETSLNGGRKVQENMQQRIQEYSSLNSRHERRVQEVEQELIDARSEMRRFRVQAENSTAEKNLMTSSVERLELDNKTLRSDRSNQMQLITTVNEALASTRRNNEEHAKGLRSERDAYHNQYNELRKRSDDAAELSKSAETKLEKEREALREDLVKERQKQHETRVTLAEAEGKVTSLEKTNEDLAANRDEYKRMYNSRIAGEANPGSEKEQLEAAIEENVELKKKVSDAEARVEQFKQIAGGAEKHMTDIQKNQEQLQKIVAEKESKHVDEVKLLGDEVAKVGAQLQAEKTNAEKRAGELAEVKAKVQSQLVAHEAALSMLRSEVDQAKETQTVAENDAKRYSQEASESMDKYQKEVILHAGDVQALQTAQEQRDEAAKALQTKASELESAQQELTASQASWAEQKRILEHKAHKEAESVIELEQQKEQLHSIMTDLKNHLTARQNADSDKVPDGNPAAVELSSKTTTDLIKVVETEKRRAEIAQTETEEVRIQFQHVESQVQQLERQLSDAKKTLQKERERNEERAIDRAKYDDLMKKLETFNLLQDSNKLLRSEENRTKAEIAALKAKVEKLGEAISPLKDDKQRLEKELKETQGARASAKNEVVMWKDRAISLRDQYQNERIDPEEHKKLVEQIKGFDAVNAGLKEQADKQGKKIQELEANVKAEAEKAKMADAEKVKWMQKNQAIKRVAKGVQLDRDKHKAECEELKKKQTELQATADAAKAADAATTDDTSKQQAQHTEELETLKTDHAIELKKKSDSILELRARDKKLVAGLKEKKKRIEALEAAAAAASGNPNPTGASAAKTDTAAKVAAKPKLRPKPKAKAKAAAPASTANTAAPVATAALAAAAAAAASAKPKVAATKPTPAATKPAKRPREADAPAAASASAATSTSAAASATAKVTPAQKKARSEKVAIKPMAAVKPAAVKPAATAAATAGTKQAEKMRAQMIARTAAKVAKAAADKKAAETAAAAALVAVAEDEGATRAQMIARSAAKVVKAAADKKAAETAAAAALVAVAEDEGATPVEEPKPASVGTKRPRETEFELAAPAAAFDPLVEPFVPAAESVESPASKKSRAMEEDILAADTAVADDGEAMETEVSTEVEEDGATSAEAEPAPDDSVAVPESAADSSVPEMTMEETDATVAAAEETFQEDTVVPGIEEADTEQPMLDDSAAAAYDDDATAAAAAAVPQAATASGDSRSIVRNSRPASLSLQANLSQSDTMVTPSLDILPPFDNEAEQVPSTPILPGTETLLGGPRMGSPVPSSRVRSALSAVPSSFPFDGGMSEAAPESDHVPSDTTNIVDETIPESEGADGLGEEVEEEEDAEPEAAVPQALDDPMAAASPPMVDADEGAAENEETDALAELDDDADEDEVAAAAAEDTAEAGDDGMVPADDDEVAAEAEAPAEAEAEAPAEAEPAAAEVDSEPAVDAAFETVEAAYDAAAMPARSASGFVPITITAPVSTPDGYPIMNTAPAVVVASVPTSKKQKATAVVAPGSTQKKAKKDPTVGRGQGSGRGRGKATRGKGGRSDRSARGGRGAGGGAAKQAQ